MTLEAEKRTLEDEKGQLAREVIALKVANQNLANEVRALKGSRELRVSLCRLGRSLLQPRTRRNWADATFCSNAESDGRSVHCDARRGRWQEEAPKLALRLRQGYEYGEGNDVHHFRAACFSLALIVERSLDLHGM